jgi:L-lactate dehydrogenase complex protein LldG
MSSRAHILYRVQRSQPAALPLPELHHAEDDSPTPLMARFTAALARMGGTLAEPPLHDSLDSFLFERFPSARVICSATPEVLGTRSIASVRDPRELDDVDVAVVRAVFGVAETGSVCLTEREFVHNALGFLAQHLVVLLDPAAILPTLHDAYREGCFLDARYAVLMSGPSATADIEGVLVRGAQGVRSLTVVPLAARAAHGAGGRGG